MYMTPVDIVVLLSLTTGLWKIADFGLTREGTSTGNKLTEHSKGTASYRAPEFNQGNHGTWNNKVDIWALGCVLFELLTGQRAFGSDMNLGVYTAMRQTSDWLDLSSPRWGGIVLDSRSRAILAGMVDAMLEANNWERPKIAQLLGVLNTLYDTSTPIWLSRCRHIGQALPGAGITLSGYVASSIAGSNSPSNSLNRVVAHFPNVAQVPPGRTWLDRTVALDKNSSLWRNVLWKAHWYPRISCNR